MISPKDLHFYCLLLGHYYGLSDLIFNPCDSEQELHDLEADMVQLLMNCSSSTQHHSVKPRIVPFLIGGNCRLTFHITGHKDVVLQDIVLLPKLTFTDRLLCGVRLVCCSLDPGVLSDSSFLHDVGKRGFAWRSHLFQYYACKDVDQFDGKAYFLRCVDENGWCSSSNVSHCTAMASPVPQEAHHLREQIGGFSGLECMSLVSYRLGLLVSGACAGVNGHCCQALHSPQDQHPQAEAATAIPVVSTCTCQYNDIRVLEVPDVTHTHMHEDGTTTSYCVTDGSGSISQDLAAQLPQRVHQGVPTHALGSEVSGPEAVSVSVTVAYQVRIYIPKAGIFKGVLLVDPSLPPNSLCVRPSMCKVTGILTHSTVRISSNGMDKDEVHHATETSSSTNDVPTHTPSMEVVVDECSDSYIHEIDMLMTQIDAMNMTAIGPDGSSRGGGNDGTKAVDVKMKAEPSPATGCGADESSKDNVSSNISTTTTGSDKTDREGLTMQYISPTSCVVDVVNTCPQAQVFASCPTGRLNKHLILVLQAIGVSSAVFCDIMRDQLKVLQKLCTDRAVAQSHCYQRSMCGNSGEGSSSLDTESYIAVADMLSAGHSMQDLYIQTLLHRMLSDELLQLQMFRLRISPCQYLMGVSDPTHTLFVDQVYIHHAAWPVPKQAQLRHRHLLVARFPLMHTDCMRLFRVEETTCLRDYFESTRCTLSGGIIVFGTNPRLSGGTGTSSAMQYSPVQGMGGDFDGDLYFCCEDERIVAPLVQQQHEASIILPLHKHIDKDRTHVAKDTCVSAPLSYPSPQPTKLSAASVATIPVPVPASTPPNAPKLFCHPATVLPSNMSEDEMCVGLFFDYLRAKQQGNGVVSRSASSWLIAADKYGVQSPEAVRLATVHRAAMNHRRLRTDASLFLRSSRLDSGSLLELHLQSLPHYMNPAEGGVNAWDKANTSRSLVQHFYQSTSVLGEVFDSYRQGSGVIDMSTAHRTWFSNKSHSYQRVTNLLDPDMCWRPTHTHTHNPSAAASALMTSPWMSVAKRLHDRYIGLFFNGYRDHQMNVGVGDVPTDNLRRQQYYSQLKMRFQALFSEIVERVHSQLTECRKTTLTTTDLAVCFASALYQYGYLQADNTLLAQQKLFTASQGSQHSSGTKSSSSKGQYLSVSKCIKMVETHCQVCWSLCRPLLNAWKVRQCAAAFGACVDGGARQCDLDSCNHTFSNREGYTLVGTASATVGTVSVQWQDITHTEELKSLLEWCM